MLDYELISQITTLTSTYSNPRDSHQTFRYGQDIVHHEVYRGESEHNERREHSEHSLGSEHTSSGSVHREQNEAHDGDRDYHEGKTKCSNHTTFHDDY